MHWKTGLKKPYKKCKNHCGHSQRAHEMNVNRKIILSEKIKDKSGLSNIISALKPRLGNKTCILLSGDLASGKTTFVQLFCESYGLRNISSPTFSLHHVYENENITLDHFDLYRLQNSDEIETSGLWDVFSKKTGLVFIEWASRISVADLPMDWTFFEVELTKSLDAAADERLIVVSSVSLS